MSYVVKVARVNLKLATQVASCLQCCRVLGSRALDSRAAEWPGFRLFILLDDVAVKAHGTLKPFFIPCFARN